MGYILTDDLHPLITRDVIKELNKKTDKSGVTYHAIEYQWNRAKKVSDIQIERIKNLF